jgi:hypothetical protein
MITISRWEYYCLYFIALMQVVAFIDRIFGE